MHINNNHTDGLTVKNIQPKELPSLLAFYVNQMYKIEVSNFVVIADNRKGILYVNSNRSIPQEDINGFLEVITFPNYWVNENDLPTGQFLDYVYYKYGFHAYRALLDSHTWHMEQKEKCKAEEASKAILPLIEQEINRENPIVKYDERLISNLYCAGLNANKKTPKNITNYENLYVFYFGYLLGAGKLKGVL